MWTHHSIPGAQCLAALAILPLPRVVLLPGMTLPINIHEPPALALLDHMRHHGQHLGVPFVAPGGPLPRVFTVARLLSHVEISATRRMIRVVGVARVEAVHEAPDTRPFRVLAVHALAELPPTDALQLVILRAQVGRILADSGDAGLGLRTLLAVRDDRVFLYTLTACLPALELMPLRELGDAELDPDDLTNAQQQSLAAATADERAALLVARTAAVLVGLARTRRGAVLH